ncbi:MAG TPA: hypothetical protein VFY10_10870 [Dehalococcoidia bacterium]|nr:hypothetical protein [Dehalococcoidia bacterium]
MEATTVTCAHHWILGQPNAGAIQASCRKCGATRVYPAVLDDLDPGVEPEARHLQGVATAVGGARPSSVATLPLEVELSLPGESRS